VGSLPADNASMQITVACHRCDHPKRPLTPCPVCTAAPLAEPELQAWRISLHAEALTRITGAPGLHRLPDEVERELMPQQVVLVLEDDYVLDAASYEVERMPATIIPLEPPVPASDAKSFDWEEDSPSWLRRSA
jgi:hypothetical protein